MLESRLLTAEGTWSMIKRGTLRCPRAVSQLAQSRDSKYRDREGHPILWRRWAPQSAAQGPHIMGMDWCMAPQVQLCTCQGLLPHPATSCHVLPLPSSPPPHCPCGAHLGGPALWHGRSFSGAQMLQSLGCAWLCAVGLLLSARPLGSSGTPAPNSPAVLQGLAEGTHPKPPSTHLCSRQPQGLPAAGHTGPGCPGAK